MIRVSDKIALTSALLALFAAGTGTGYFIAKKSTAPAAASDTQTTLSDTTTTDWWQRSLNRLASDLNLNETQKNAVRPMLQRTADQMFLNRDRALFQIHLELLAFHDTLGRPGTFLDATQKMRLDTLRARLRQQIETQFPQFLKDSPLPPVTAASGL